MAERLWLDVPYAEKDQAKAAGARWDQEARRWYAPRADLLPGLARWRPKEQEREQRTPVAPPSGPVPTHFPGEDRAFGRGLFVDLVPRSCWFTNVRSCVEPSQWDGLRKMVYRRADWHCEACGAAGAQLEAHERWAYDEATRTQHLRRLICLCHDCHEATHYGFASIKGRDAEARAHLAAVNGWSAAQTARHIDEAAAVWRRRNTVDWSLDLSMLTDAGITVRRPPSAAERREQGTHRPPG
ncbi:DUF5710 domain-containing protein [Modestobacter sp. NPDC049651]|uniref:DUF5710 domain-containing protein n=1 Tax=unclassified Modestobacter TaxID=2643866 RepID=UPI0033F5DF5E